MKNIAVLLVFTLTLAAGAIKAHALLLQGPNGLYSPIFPIFSKPIDTLPQDPAPDLSAPVGATVLIESYPIIPGYN